MQDQRRVVIDYVSPSVNCGQFYIKRVVNEIVNVQAHILADGHDVLGASVLYKHENEKKCFFMVRYIKSCTIDLVSV